MLALGLSVKKCIYKKSNPKYRGSVLNTKQNGLMDQCLMDHLKHYKQHIWKREKQHTHRQKVKAKT